MGFNKNDLLAAATQDFILSNTTQAEQIEFIKDQIEDPFDGGSANYFKRLREQIRGDEMDMVCRDLLACMEDRFPNMLFDLEDYDQSSALVFEPVYKFFVKNIQSLVYKFLREYIYSPKNQKALTKEYLTAKIPNYPKEQYGKKEYYILITKLQAIVKDIMKDDEIRITDFIEYLERAGDNHMYVVLVKQLLDDGILCDHGILADLFSLFKKSDKFDYTMNKLQMDITTNIIDPYLQENGLMSLKLPPIQAIDDDSDEDDDEENSDE